MSYVQRPEYLLTEVERLLVVKLAEKHITNDHLSLREGYWWGLATFKSVERLLVHTFPYSRLFAYSEVESPPHDKDISQTARTTLHSIHVVFLIVVRVCIDLHTGLAEAGSGPFACAEAEMDMNPSFPLVLIHHFIY